MSETTAGLYLHVPFCDRVCPYCDFAVRTGDRARRARFVDHLLDEIDLWSDWEQPFDTIYFGGGTPSALLPEELGRIVERARQRLPFSGDERIFVEANPEHVTPESAEAWSALGETTISLGVQSFDDAGLRFLGRGHDAATARRAVERVRAAGFATVSIDLIYGLPGQTATEWTREMDRALELDPDHVSCYQLTIHPGTRFGLLERRGRLVQLCSDDQGDLFRRTHEHLNGAGLQGYEVSQFAAESRHRSRHNAKYWRHVPYLGLGPSAHSYLERRRWWNLRRTDPWQERVAAGRRPIEGHEELTVAALVLEAMMTGLRTYDGVDLSLVRRRWGVDLVETDGPWIQRLEAEGRVERRGERIVPTLEGLALADSLAAGFSFGVSPGAPGYPVTG